MILFLHTISNEVGRLLKNQTISERYTHQKRKTARILRSAKDALEFEVPGVYHECREVNVGQTGELARRGAQNTGNQLRQNINSARVTASTSVASHY